MAGSAYALVNTTVGAAAPMSQIALTAATVRARVRGFQIGDTVSTTAGGVRFVLNQATTDGTSTAISTNKLDLNSPAAITVSRSTFTATSTQAANHTVDVGFDRVGTYILWFPPGVEPFVGTTGKLALIKQILLGTDETEIKMILTTPFCPYAGSMIQQVKEQAESVVEHDVKVTLLAERWDPRDAGLMW